MFNKYGYAELIKTLERYDIPHQGVKVIPFIHMIEALENMHYD